MLSGGNAIQQGRIFKIIAQCDSKNVSSNPDETKLRLNNLLEASGKRIETIKKLVEYLEKNVHYESGQGLRTTLKTGRLSLRMALALAYYFDVSPYYIIAKRPDPGKFSETEMEQLVEKYKGKEFLSNIDRGELKKFFDGILDASIEVLNEARKLTGDQTVDFLKSLLTLEKVKEEYQKAVEAIKIILWKTLGN